ncbi:F-box only protein 6-like [Melanotaenia boesemani]|uniref:F-box only protein 6-like n=1 Tax=Melanotaenia boesemani TaxID=1250792 RepID=UPI001C053D22|nr:F-box only protein 6-like [Melanotaenia boesemani]
MKRKAMDPSLCSDWRSPTPTSPPASPAALYSVDILESIFLNLPPHQLVCLCRLVCHQWKEVADLQSFWKTRCRREGYLLCDSYKIPEDWRLFYFLCKMRRNLIKNPRGDEGMNA